MWLSRSIVEEYKLLVGTEGKVGYITSHPHGPFLRRSLQEVKAAASQTRLSSSTLTIRWKNTEEIKNGVLSYLNTNVLR